MKKVLVTGVLGQLGFDIVKQLKARSIEVLGIDIDDLDITDKQKTISYITKFKPTLVIHSAAYTAVDKAEDEPSKCTLVNVEGAKNIATACQKIGAEMVYISTDYVYGGEGDLPYSESHTPNPLSVYGRTKLGGERAVSAALDNYYIVRTSWVFGINGNNFVKTMLRLGREKPEIKVVADQIGSPTYTVDLAKAIISLAETKKYGIYNVSNEGYCSWCEFATQILECSKITIPVDAITTAEFPTKAVRPRNSRMSKDKLYSAGVSKMPHWTDALRRYLKEIEKQQQ